MKNIEITNIKKVKEFIKKHEDPDFGGFELKSKQDKLLLIGWNEEIEIKLNVNFTTFIFSDFYTLIYSPIKLELTKYSNRKKFWLLD